MRIDHSRVGMIAGPPVAHSGGFDYLVFFSADEQQYYADEKLDLALGGPGDDYLGHREFLRDLALLKLREPLADNLYSFQASRTLFRVYQFKPALKFLNSPEQRILIADEVGLGKTIEAGIIYLELKARLDLERVLVVCPSGLREKWHSELRSRFDEEFAILDKKALERFLEDYRQHGGRTTLKGICSLELLRREELAQAFADLDITLDLVIIDEAHHLRNAGTLSYALGEVLADQAGALVLLTATPLHTGNENLFHLMRLINPGEFANFGEFADRIAPNQFINSASRFLGGGEFLAALEALKAVEGTPLGRRYRSNPYYREIVDLLKLKRPLTTTETVSIQRRLLELNTLSRVFNRTRKREVADAAVRCPFTLQVQFSEAERAFYDAVVEFVRWQLKRNGELRDAPVFSVIMRERQAASCIQALRTTFENALEASLLSLDAEESRSDLSEESGYREHLGESERSRIHDLLRLCRALGDEDSKFATFFTALQALLVDDPTNKVLVFSFFRGTIAYLEKRLKAEGIRVCTLHGGIPVIEREAIIREFHDNPAINVMVTSEVGAEGLDFQFCGAMFNYDLPWNPMKVEQRIGRLDRFGQQHEKILIYNLVIADTIETRIFVRLYERIRLFESSIGDLEAILGNEIRDLSRDVFMSRLTKDQEIRRAEEAAKRIERYRQEQEEFERQRLAFLGQDELFAQEMQEALDSGRFVAPDELRSLLECFLAERQFARTLLESDDEDPTCFLVPDQELLRYLSAVATRNRQIAPRVRQFLGQLNSNNGRGVALTFDPGTARERRLVEFITAHHPLAVAAADYFGQKGRPSAPRACLWASSPSGRIADCAFFIYRLTIHSIKDLQGKVPQTTLVPVLVDLASGEMQSDLATGFLAEVQSRRDLVPPSIACEPASLAEIQAKAQGYIARLVRERERDEQAHNDALVEARLGSLEQSYAFRTNAARQQMNTVSDERIRRMRRAQIDNLAGALAAKKKEIEDRRQVSVGYELVASGLVRFSPAIARLHSREEDTTLTRRPASQESAASPAPEAPQPMPARKPRQSPSAKKGPAAAGPVEPMEPQPAPSEPVVPPPRAEEPAVQPKIEPPAFRPPTKKNKGFFDRLREWLGS